MLIFFFKYHFTKLSTKLQRAILPGNGCDGCEMLLSDGSDGNLRPVAGMRRKRASRPV